MGGLPFPPPGDLPDPGIKPASPDRLRWQANSLLPSHLGSPLSAVYNHKTSKISLKNKASVLSHEREILRVEWLSGILVSRCHFYSSGIFLAQTPCLCISSPLVWFASESMMAPMVLGHTSAKHTRHFQVSWVQLLSCVWLSATPWTAALQASLSITNSQSLFELMPITSVMPTNYLFCHPFFLLPPVFPSVRVFSNESALHIRWSKYWSFRFSNSASNEYSGLISFRMGWLDLLAVQETLKSLL